MFSFVGTQAETDLANAKGYDISPGMHARADKLLEYVALRKNELTVLLKMIDAGSSDGFIPELNAVRAKIHTIIAELQ